MEEKKPLKDMSITLRGDELCRLVQIYAAQRLAKVGRPAADSNFRLVPLKDFHKLTPSTLFARDVLGGEDLFVKGVKRSWKVEAQGETNDPA